MAKGVEQMSLQDGKHSGTYQLNVRVSHICIDVIECAQIQIHVLNALA